MYNRCIGREGGGAGYTLYKRTNTAHILTYECDVVIVFCSSSCWNQMMSSSKEFPCGRMFEKNAKYLFENEYVCLTKT